MNLALNDIRLTSKLFPDLGGEKWTPKYDELLKQIQRAAGHEPIGLEAFKEPEEATGD